MYGDFLNAVGFAFILFLIIMFTGFLFKAGYSGIVKNLLIKILIIISFTICCAFLGIVIYSVATSKNPFDILNYLVDIIKEKALKIGS